MPGQTFVDERVVRVEQVHHAAVFAQDRFEQQLGFTPERLTQLAVEHLRLRADIVELAKKQPLCGEIVDERLRASVGQHPPRLPLELRRIASLPACASASSSSSGTLLHRKNESRDASSKSLMR